MCPTVVTLADENTTGAGIDIGSEIAMFFEIPDIDDPVYGKATGLTGEFRLFTPYGSFPTPNYFLKEKAEADRILSNYVKRAGYLFENHEEDKVRAMIENYLLVCLYMVPTADVEGPETRFIFDTIAGGFYMDDIVDVAEDLSDLNITCGSIYKRVSSWEKLFAGEYEEFAKFGLYFPATAKGWDYLVDGAREVDAEIPDFRAKIRNCARAWIDSLAATPLLIGLHKPGDRYSEESFKLVRGYNAAMQCTLELALDFNGAQLCEYVRSTLLYRNLIASYNIVSGLLNDILGLAKDVKEKCTNDTVTLRKVINHGVPLQESFRQALESITDAIHDARLSLKLLQETFPEDEQLPKFCQIFKYCMDGEIYSYKAWAKVRYGNIKLELKPVTNRPKQA